jgi:hypothetical protein
MTLGQIIDRIFRLLRARLRLFLEIALVPSLTVAGVIAVAIGCVLLVVLPTVRGRNTSPDPRMIETIFAGAFLALLAFLPIFGLYAAAAACAVVRTNLGQAVSSAQCWGVAWQQRGRYIWLTFLLGLIVAAPVYASWGLCAGGLALAGLSSRPHTPPPLAFVLIPFAILLVIGSYVYMILMMLRYSLSFAACVLEDLPAAGAIRRSAVLTRGAKGRIFLVMLVMYAAGIAFNMLCEALIFLVGGVGALAASLVHVRAHSAVFLYFVLPLGILALIALFLAMVTLPYAGYSTALGILYCDQCFRVDGALPALTAADGQS